MSTPTEPSFPALRLPASLEPQRPRYLAALREAIATLERFAREHGWGALVASALPSVVEVHPDQAALWQRLREAFALPPDAPLPTPSLAGAVVGDALVVVTPEAYALVAPRYAAAPGAYVRLLAHELGHRLHVAVVAGDEEAMGPRWFYEGFAVLASDDLHGLVEVTPADVWAHLDADGDDAYARYGAALRLFTRYVPLREIVAAASRTDVRDWLQARLAQADAAR